MLAGGRVVAGEVVAGAEVGQGTSLRVRVAELPEQGQGLAEAPDGLGRVGDQEVGVGLTHTPGPGAAEATVLTSP